MSDTRPWHDETGWAWELELLVLIFVALASILPMAVELQRPPPLPHAAEDAATVGQTNGTITEYDLSEVKAQMDALLGLLIVIGLYIGHLILVHNSLVFLSTPPVYLFSPLVFGGVAYYRLLHHTTLQGMSMPLMQGSLYEKIAYPIIILTITILLAWLRMKRQMRRYKKMDWVYKTNAHRDRGILADFGTSLMPVIYPPRDFWVSKQGVLIRGSLYLIPLSFSHIQSIVQTKRRSHASNQLDLCTSGHNPVRIQTTESRQPIMITPKHPDEFVFHCMEANPQASHLFSASATSHG